MVGIDLIDIARVKKAAESPRFYARVFTDNERAYFEATGRRAETLAGFFAAKEAALKALKIGFSLCMPNEVGVEHDKSGSPYLVFTGNAAKHLGNRRTEVSITHTESTAAAVCIVL